MKPRPAALLAHRLACLLLWLAALAPCAMARDLKLLTEDYPPFNIPATDTGPVSGLSTDIVRTLLQRAGIGYTIAMLPWTRALELAATQHDTCVYSTIRTAKREPRYKWIGPIASDDWALFAMAGSPLALSSLEEAKQYRLGGYMGDAAGDYLVSRGLDVDLAQSDKLNPRKLAAGRIDLWIAGMRTGPWVARRQGIGAIRPVLTFGEAKHYQMYLACHPSMPDATVTRLNRLLQDMQRDGTVAAIGARY